MNKSKSTLVAFAALIALGATLDVQARGQGGGMAGGQGMGQMSGQGAAQMGGQGEGQYKGQGSGQKQKAQGTGDMTRERTQTREMIRSGTPDMQQDMAQRRAMQQENRRVQEATPADAAVTQ